MNADHFRALEQLFHRARQASGSARDDVLRQAARDPDLLAELQRLLAAESLDTSPLDTPTTLVEQSDAATPLGSIAPRTPTDDQRADQPAAVLAHPATIGRYHIQGLLGEGAMGVVYRASQDSPARVVALKVLRPEYVGPHELRRFSHEAAALALLQHPGIAQIYDAGVDAASGLVRPYLAMELIEGHTLTEHADRAALTLQGRIALLAAVADALHHAHQRGVIHRDLKPANILVSASAAQPQPKIVDFGVARLVRPGAGNATLHTQRGTLVGTLAYMSPEQLAGDPSAASVASDVYALGVILYQLLTGRLPHKVEHLPIAEAARRIRDDEPPAPSSIDRSLRGDLDIIIMKAISKEPDRRYHSAAELADDLRRNLRNEPISAHPPSGLYQLRKFASRHRPLVVAAAAILLTLSIAVVLTSLALARSVRSERAAEELARLQEIEADRAESIADFLRRMLTGISPAAARGKDTALLRGILDDAARAVDDPSLDVLVRAALHDILGEAYRSIGKLPDAEHHLTRTLALRTQQDPDSAATAMAAGNLGSFYRSELERPDLAAPHLEHAYRALLTLRGPGDSNTLAARNNLAVLYMTIGRFPDAQALLEEQLRILTDALGRSHEATARVLSNLASIHDLLDREPMAGALMREAYDLRTARLGETHPETIATRVNYGSYHLKRGRLAEAEPLIEGAHNILLTVAGPDHPRTLAAAGHLAKLRARQNRPEEAIELYDDAIQRGSRVLGPDHPNVSGWRLSRAQAFHALGRSEIAAQEAARAIAESREQYPSSSWLLAARLLELGELLIEQSNPDAAEPLLREAIGPLATALGPRGHATKRCAALLARIAEAKGRHEEAAQLRAEAGLDSSPASQTPPK